ncbi:MAG: hypothetical protein M0Q51_15130 [Bacteroidales bacterium]|nr:hypothetical protein [Bacteroidales bacterium]
MKNEQFENDIKAVPDVFRKLSIVETDGEKILKGELDIIDTTGKLWDTYQIEIKGSYHYPSGFPKLFETGNAFPKIADWHVYEDNKSCCVDVTPNEVIICKEGLNVGDYIHRFAIPYFANQTFRKREGYYLYGEYSHGILGRIEFYQSKLKAKSPVELIAMFDLIIKDYNPARTAYCPFCHKVKFRHCHRNAFRELQNVKGFLANDGLVFLPFFKANPDFKLP